MSKKEEIKLKYPSERLRALRSVLRKKNTTLEIELMECLFNFYKKNVKQEVRDFIEEMEEDETQEIQKARNAVTRQAE